MNTEPASPTPQPILPGKEVPFPCWLFDPETKTKWFYYTSPPQSFVEDITHYLLAPYTADPTTFPMPGKTTEMDHRVAWVKSYRSDHGVSLRIAMEAYDREFPAAFPSPASAEAGDWADAAAKEIHNAEYPLAENEEQDETKMAAIIRRHAPQSQSKAEAVGAEWFSPASEAEMTFPCFVWFDEHLGEEAGWSLQRNRGEYECRTSGGFKASRFACVRLAHPATQNPPENAKGELDAAFLSVIAERERQNKKWGEQNHDPITWSAILSEECGEFAEAALHKKFGGHAADGLRDEAVHCAAVAVQIIQYLDRTMSRPQPTQSTREEGGT